MQSRSVSDLYSRFPLQARFIRLLKPELVTNQSLLTYDFEVVELHHAPAFHALSYVWGESHTNKNIMVEGTVLPVTDNLHCALRKIQNSSGQCHQDQDQTSVLLWVDQICINQSDMPELSAQVDMMASLYSLATTVVIDLGDAADDSEAVQLVDDMSQYIREQDSFGQSFDQWPYLAGEENDRIMKQNWPALGTMLSSTWFERAWVVQEVGLAKHASVLYGKCLFDWQSLMLLLGWLSHPGSRLYHYYRLPGWTTYHIWVSFSPEARNRDAGFEQLDALDLLGHTSHSFHAARPYDYLYAFLGHPSMQNADGLSGYRSGVKPNYDSPLCDVYVDFAKWWLKQNGRSHILSCVNHVSGPLRRSKSPSRDTKSDITKTKALAKLGTSATTTNASQLKSPWRCGAQNPPRAVSLVEKKRAAAMQQTGCPSWCPRWDWLPLGGTRLDKAQNEVQASWTASGASKFVYRFLSDNRLEMAGKCFDTVGRVLPTLNDVRQEMRSRSGPWKHIRESGLSDDSIETILALSQLCWRVLQCESESRPDPEQIQQQQQHRLPAFAAAATASYDWAASVHGQGPMADFAASIREAWSSRRADDSNSKRQMNLSSPCEVALDTVYGLTQRIEVSDVAPARFPMAATRMCESRRLFVTVGGRIGSGPEWLAVNDICCVVSGAGVPYMLRSAESEQAHYLLVGECYVYGAMGGEIVQERGERCADTGEIWERIVLE